MTARFTMRRAAWEVARRIHHARKLQDAYVTMTKTFAGRVPKTIFRITDGGRQALDEHWQMLDRLRAEHGRTRSP